MLADFAYECSSQFCTAPSMGQTGPKAFTTLEFKMAICCIPRGVGGVVHK